MKKLIILIAVSFIYFSSNAQGVGLGATDQDFIREAARKQPEQNQMKKSKMNYFLDQEWKGGVIFTKDSLTINNYLFRYNIYTDQIEYRTVVNPNDVKVISIGTNKFIFTEYFDEDSIKNKGYFELIENGECKLLLRRNIKYSEGRDDIDAYGSSSTTNVKESLYIKKGNAPAIFIDKTKESIKNIFSDKPEMDKYIDKKFILFLSKKALQDIVNYYNKI